MHPDLAALLELQKEDGAVEAIESRLRDVDARAAVMDRERDALGTAVERARATLEAEERRRNELAHKVDEHKQLQQRNLSVLDGVWKPREATAAMAQIDLTRKVLAQEESDLHGIVGRIQDLRQALELQQLELSELDDRQRSARKELVQERRSVEAELERARAVRGERASKVSRGVLQKYERIRERDRSAALYPLRGQACGRCNTAIPLQRRNVIAAGRSIEVCEGCGVLLYAAG